MWVRLQPEVDFEAREIVRDGIYHLEDYLGSTSMIFRDLIME